MSYIWTSTHMTPTLKNLPVHFLFPKYLIKSIFYLLNIINHLPKIQKLPFTFNERYYSFIWYMGKKRDIVSTTRGRY